MNIDYLKNVKSWIEKNRRNGLGVPIAEIEQLEAKIGFIFPKAYKEFLFLSGKRFQPWIESHELDYIIANEFNETAPSILEEYDIKLPKNNYWVISNEDAAMRIFYFDEGDNPPVYVCEYESKNLRPDYYRMTSKTFTEFMQHWIDVYDPRKFY